MTSQIVPRILTEMGITNYSVEWAKNIYSDYYKGPNDNATEENMEKEGVDLVSLLISARASHRAYCCVPMLGGADMFTLVIEGTRRFRTS